MTNGAISTIRPGLQPVWDLARLTTALPRYFRQQGTISRGNEATAAQLAGQGYAVPAALRAPDPRAAAADLTLGEIAERNRPLLSRLAEDVLLNPLQLVNAFIPGIPQAWRAAKRGLSLGGPVGANLGQSWAYRDVIPTPLSPRQRKLALEHRFNPNQMWFHGTARDFPHFRKDLTPSERLTASLDADEGVFISSNPQVSAQYAEEAGKDLFRTRDNAIRRQFMENPEMRSFVRESAREAGYSAARWQDFTEQLARGALVTPQHRMAAAALGLDYSGPNIRPLVTRGAFREVDVSGRPWNESTFLEEIELTKGENDPVSELYRLYDQGELSTERFNRLLREAREEGGEGWAGVDFRNIADNIGNQGTIFGTTRVVFDPEDVAPVFDPRWRSLGNPLLAAAFPPQFASENPIEQARRPPWPTL